MHYLNISTNAKEMQYFGPLTVVTTIQFIQQTQGSKKEYPTFT